MGAIYARSLQIRPLLSLRGVWLGHGLTEPLLYDPLVPIVEP